jgi:predicted murein hydrolase (TIGR00659 family)
MREILINSAFFAVMLSLSAYQIGILVKKKLKLAIFNPLLIAILIVMLALFLLRVDYKSYNSGAKFLSYLLTPATVCLAIPLYEQFEFLKHNFKAIIVGIAAGVLSSLLCIFLFSLLFHFNHTQYVTLLPKSITTAIGIGVSEELGGIVAVTVTAIVITGITGNMFAEAICKIFKINEPVAKGVAIGTSSHVLGTAKAIEIGEIEGAMSSLSIVVAGLITVFGAVVFSRFI